MQPTRFPERRPFVLSALLVLLLLLVQGTGVYVAQYFGYPSGTFSIVTELILAIALVVIVSAMRWWGTIGFKPISAKHLLTFLPALVLVIGNLTFGIHVSQPRALVIFALLALLSGFVEETIFRGLMLRSFLPKGEWMAVGVTAAIFGLVHSANAFAEANLPYVFVQICYAFAIGFAFAAAALRGGAIWPLVIVHALGNFVAFINSDTGALTGGDVNTQVMIVSIFYVIWFTAYGIFLMRQRAASPVQTAAQPS